MRALRQQLRFALVFCGFCGVVALGGWFVVWLAKKMGATSDLSEFVREAVRYGSGDGTIRVIRRKTRQSKYDGQPSSLESLRHREPRRRGQAAARLLSPSPQGLAPQQGQDPHRIFQILSSMPWVLNQIRYPPAFDAVSNAFSFLDLHILRVTSLECVVESWSFYHVLFVSTVTPVLLSALLYVATACRVAWLLKRVPHDADPDARLDAAQAQLEDANRDDDGRVVAFSLDNLRKERLEMKRNKAIREVRNQGIFLWLLLSFLIYPSVSTVCFQFFSCEKFRGFDNARGNKRVLQVDYSISCRSRDYKAVKVYAICSLLLYPVGIPLIYFVLLWSHRRKINPDLDDADVLRPLDIAPEDHQFLITAGRELSFVTQLLKVNKRDTDQSIQHLSFLYEEYECRAYLFSVFDCFRKLALSGLLVFLYPGSSTQIGFATLFALICAKVYSHVRPYVEDEDDLIAEFAMEALTIVFFLSLMLYVSTQCEEADNQTNKATRVFAGPVFSGTVIALLSCLLLITFSIILLEVFGYEAISNTLVNALSSASANKHNVLRTLSETSRSSHSTPRSPRKFPAATDDDLGRRGDHPPRLRGLAATTATSLETLARRSNPRLAPGLCPAERLLRLRCSRCRAGRS